MTAMSVFGSVPTTLALSSRLSESRTRISSAFETTWLFVMMCPLGSAITPDPRLRSRRSCGASNRRLKNSSPKNRRKKGSSNGPKLCPSGTRLIRVVEMFTTAGVTALATSTKLWSAPSDGGGTVTGFGTLGASGTACPIGSHPRSEATTSPRMTPTPIRSRPSASVFLCDSPGIDSCDRPEQLERVGFLALEGVAPDDGPEPASVADRSGFFEEGVVVFLGGPAGEDHDAAPVEGRLHDVPDPIGQRLDRNLLHLVHFLRRRLLQVIGRQLHLDDVGAQLGRDLRRIGDDVERRLAFLADLAAAGIGPDNERQAMPFGFFPDLAGLLVHALPVRRSGIDGEPYRHAAEPQRVPHAARDRRRRVLLLVEDIVVVQLQDQRNLARELRRARLQEPERRSVGVAAGLDRQLEVVSGIVARRIDREAPGRAVLEALVHRQNQAFAGPLQRTVVQNARQGRLHAGVIRTVPTEDLAHAVRHGFLLSFPLDERLSQADISRTADQQRPPLVQGLRLDLEDAHGPGAGAPARLLHDHRQRVRLIQQAQLPFRLVRLAGIQVDPPAEEHAVHVSGQAPRVSRRVRPSCRLVGFLEIINVPARAGRPFVVITLADS